MSHVEPVDETQCPYIHNWSWEGDLYTLWINHKYDRAKYGRVVLSKKFFMEASKPALMEKLIEEYACVMAGLGSV